jgi:hypothetical protein
MFKLLGGALMLVSSYQLTVTGDLFFVQSLLIGLGVFFSELLMSSISMVKEDSGCSRYTDLCGVNAKE